MQILGSRIAVIVIVVLLALAGCGGGSSEDHHVAEEHVAIVYDEAINGSLPYTLDYLSQTELAKFTATLTAGTNVVRGTSISGEAILLKIPAGAHLKSIDIDFTNHNGPNALVVFVERAPYDGTSFIDNHSMADSDRYTYTISAPNINFGDGDYILSISTAVSLARFPNEFSIGIHVE